MKSLIEALKPAIIKDPNLHRHFKLWCLLDSETPESQEVGFVICMNNWEWEKVLNDLSQEQLNAIETFMLEEYEDRLTYYSESGKPIPSSFVRWEKEALRKINLIVKERKCNEQ